MATEPHELTASQFLEVLGSFELSAFSTLDFCSRVAERYPAAWATIVERYGEGGAGAGRHYTAFSRVSHILDYWFRRKEVDKLDYRPAPVGWGSPVIRYWTLDRERVGGSYYPDELVISDGFPEGGKQTITVNRYERNRDARAACIEHHGLRCKACEVSFEERYGVYGAGFIHIHHLKKLSEIGKEYKVNPITDLVPVCPNCHAMIHRSAKPLTISELKKVLARAAKSHAKAVQD